MFILQHNHLMFSLFRVRTKWIVFWDFHDSYEPCLLKYAKPKVQFPFYGLRRLKLFSGERDDHTHIILTCWGVIGTILGNHYLVQKASLFRAANTFRVTWSARLPRIRHQVN